MSDQTGSTRTVEAGAGSRAEPAEPGVGAAAGDLSRRVSAIIDAAEEEAERLREEAREQGRRYLEAAGQQADRALAERQRRIAELSDELIAGVEAMVARLDDATPVRRSFERLVRSLGEAADRLAEEGERSRGEFHPRRVPQPPRGPWARGDGPGAGRPLLDSDADDRVAGAPTDGANGAGSFAPAAGGEAGRPASQPDGVRAIVIQMAAAGWTRHELSDHLERTLGLADPEPVLDEVFGAGSADDARVPWTTYPR